MLRRGRAALLAGYAVVIIIPLILVVSGSVRTTQEFFDHPLSLPTSPTLGNFGEVIVQKGLGQAFVNSLVVTVVGVVLTLMLASLAAFACARLHGWQSVILYSVLILGVAVPAQTSMIAQYVTLRAVGLGDTLAGLVLIETAVTLPLAVFILTGFMRSVPPQLHEAAALDGAGHWATYAKIVMPLSRPALGATAIYVLVIQWNDLLYPLLLIVEPSKATLPLALLNFQGEFLTNYPLLFAGVIIATAPILLAFLLLQRHFIAGLTAGAVK